MKSLSIILPAVLLTMLLALSCARIGAPPGGPEDKTGPRVVSSFPVPDTTNVPRKLVARLVFSKPVNHKSVEAALYMSPDPRQRLRYHWHGNTLDLIYLDSLLENRTYVISMGSQAKDTRGNPAGTTTTVAFSTGSRIDRGSVDGWVSDVAAPQAVSVWAYHLRGDTVPNPISDEADYRLQVGSDSRFHFGYLREGRYRVFAVNDRNFDGLWNPSAEPIGIPPWDVTVGDSLTPWLSFRLMMQDSAAPTLRALREFNEHEMDVRTSRAVPVLQGHFVSGTGDSIRQLDAFPDSAGSEIWRVFPERPLTAGLWTVTVSGMDNLGLRFTATDTVSARALPDTARPHMTTDPAARMMTRIPPSAMHLMFDKPVTLDSLAPINFRMTAGTDTDTVVVRLQIRNPHMWDVVPATPLLAGKPVKLRFDGRAVRDLAGHTLLDTTVNVQFGVLSPDSMGGIKGELATKVSAPYLYRMLSFKGRTTEVAKTVAPGPGAFSLELLPVGKYLIEVTRDANRDSTYSYGRMWPFNFSEPFLTSPDTVTIRARWEYETQINWQDNR
ncbi:MAG TPA: Ig-like domain-containing protein [bacterium]